MARANETVVLDIGSGETKFGFGGETAPRGAFPTIIGVPLRHIKTDLHLKDYYVGDEAIVSQGFCKFKFPIKQGAVLNWRDVDKIWSYIFEDQLKISTEDYYILFSEPPFNSKRNREDVTQRIFEKYNARGAFAGLAPVLGLYSAGRTTGYVIDSGEGQTYMVPVNDGNALYHHVQRLQVGGRDLTEHLAALLQHQGLKFTMHAEKETVKKIKEELGYAAINLPQELKLARESNCIARRYTLPDGLEVQLNGERFLCGEPLFQPSLIGVEQHGIADLTASTIGQCEPSLGNIMFQNIVFSGGNTMFPGIDHRLERDLSLQLPRSVRVRTHASADRKYATWIGGSILSVMPTLQQMWITRSDYGEMGPEIVHHKCF